MDKQEDKTKVSKAMANFFMDQCRGETSGHMAMIPNNPTLFGVCMAHEINTCGDFADFLRSVANEIDPPLFNT